MVVRTGAGRQAMVGNSVNTKPVSDATATPGGGVEAKPGGKLVMEGVATVVMLMFVPSGDEYAQGAGEKAARSIPSANAISIAHIVLIKVALSTPIIPVS